MGRRCQQFLGSPTHMKVTFHDDEDEALDEIFGDEDRYVAEVAFTTEYAAAVNFGGDPHWPPLTPMFRWTDRMGWENYDMNDSMSEDDMWNYIDQRRSANEPLPAAYLLASHIAENGTEAMYYASDAVSESQRSADSWAEQNIAETDSLENIAINFANYSLELASDNLLDRVSSATTGSSGLLGSMQPAELVSP